MNQKEGEVGGRTKIKVTTPTFPAGIEENIQIRWCKGRDSNRGPHQYELQRNDLSCLV
jgi:hypothetical protein